jgi:Putative zinc-finger
MTCQEFQILMNREIDGVLDPAGETHLSGHLAGCPRCASERASLQAIRGACRDLRNVDVRPGLAEAIIERATSPLAPVLRFPRHVLIPVAASILALCLISFALGSRYGDLPGVPPVRASHDWKRLDEAEYRGFLSGKIGLPADQVNTIIQVRRDTDQKREAADADRKEQFDRLSKSEIEEIWKLLSEDARARYLEHDPTFAVPR